MPRFLHQKNSNSKVDAVRELYNLGFNVLPLEYGSKKAAGNWKPLQTTKLPEHCLDWQFENRNVGVVVGHTSMNLFVVDCDSNESFNYWAEILRRKGWDKWVVGSKRGGHFWFLSADGEVKSIQTNTKKNISPEKDYQIWGRNHIMVAPPSVRKEAGNPDFKYKWSIRDGKLPPILKAEEIEATFPHMKVIKKLMDGGLTQLAYRAIVEGSDDGYASHSEAEFAAFMSLLRIGWSENEILNLFDKYHPPHYAKNQSDPDWFERYASMPAHEKVKGNRGEIMENVTDWASNKKWEGRTGKTDKLVFEACCKRAKLESPHRFRATSREISEMCNRSAKSVNNSLRRLVSNGCILLISEQKFERVKSANYYCFPDNVRNYHSIKNTVCTITVVVSTDIREHDVWHPFGLGKTALFVYEYLYGAKRYMDVTVQGITSALQQQFDVSKLTVKKSLSRLAENGLVIERDGKWKAIPADLNQLNEIATKLGVAGKTQKREERHKKERQDYALRIMVGTQRPPRKKFQIRMQKQQRTGLGLRLIWNQNLFMWQMMQWIKNQ